MKCFCLSLSLYPANPCIQPITVSSQSLYPTILQEQNPTTQDFFTVSLSCTTYKWGQRSNFSYRREWQLYIHCISTIFHTSNRRLKNCCYSPTKICGTCIQISHFVQRRYFVTADKNNTDQQQRAKVLKPCEERATQTTCCGFSNKVLCITMT